MMTKNYNPSLKKEGISEETESKMDKYCNDRKFDSHNYARKMHDFKKI